MPRPRHAAHEGEVRLKTDEAWWAAYQNDLEIGGFGVPWEPYGFYSGMGQEDVAREENDRIILENPAKSGNFSPISNGNHPQPTSGNIPISQIGNLGRQEEPAPDVAGRIDRAIKRNPQQGRETVAEKIRREREVLEQLAAQEPGIAIPFQEVSDINETNEHNIRIAPDGRFWKYTKGDQYGYIPVDKYPDLHDFSKVALGIDPASPSQYVERIRLHNRQ